MKQVNFTQLSPFRIVRFAARRTRQFKRLLAYSKADEINFLSGLGDSSYLLYGLVRAMKPDVCVEIGSGARQIRMLRWNGSQRERSRQAICDRSRLQTDLETSDHRYIRYLLEQLSRSTWVSENAKIVRMTSEEPLKDGAGRLT